VRRSRVSLFRFTCVREIGGVSFDSVEPLTGDRPDEDDSAWTLGWSFAAVRAGKLQGGNGCSREGGGLGAFLSETQL